MLFGIGVPMDKASGWSDVMEAADEGSPKAMCLVGLGWEHGRDGPSNGRKDLAQATAWYVKAANAGHTEAMRRLWYGDTVGLTNQQKREWLLEAARRGNATAMTNLVVVLEKEGKGKDAFEAYVQLALSPLEKLHGDNKSMKRLAARTRLMRVSLQDELGIPPNRTAAYAWATLISEDPDAQGFKTARGNAAAEKARAQLAKEAGTPMPTTVAGHMAAWVKKLHQEATPEEQDDNARFLELARNRLKLAVAHGRVVATQSEARAGAASPQEAQLLCNGEPSCLRFTVGRAWRGAIPATRSLRAKRHRVHFHRDGSGSLTREGEALKLKLKCHPGIDLGGRRGLSRQISVVDELNQNVQQLELMCWAINNDIKDAQESEPATCSGSIEWNGTTTSAASTAVETAGSPSSGAIRSGSRVRTAKVNAVR